MRPSKLLCDMIRLNKRRAYKTAYLAGLHPVTLSKLINFIEPIKRDDPRILAVGRVLGLPPEECFEEDEPS